MNCVDDGEFLVTRGDLFVDVDDDDAFLLLVAREEDVDEVEDALRLRGGGACAVIVSSIINVSGLASTIPKWEGELDVTEDEDVDDVDEDEEERISSL